MRITAKFSGEVTKFGGDSLNDSKVIQLFRDGGGGEGGLESPPPVSIVLRRFYVLVYSTQRRML